MTFLPATFAFLLSTGGTLYGCHLAGMPAHDLALAGSLAAAASATAAYGATFLAKHKRG